MSQLLTAEERSALQEPYTAADRSAKPITPAVFPSVDQFDDSRIALLAESFRRWLVFVAEDLSGLVRTTCTARPPRYRHVEAGLPSSVEAEPFWAAVDGAPGSELLIALPRQFAAALSERIFGAPFELRDDRTLTPAEITLLQDLIQRWFTGMPEAWDGRSIRLLPPGDEDESAPAEEGPVWLQFESDLLCGTVVGGISVCLAPVTARVLLGEAKNSADARPTAPALCSQLGDVPVELRAVLGRATFTLDELSSLRVGDVIALDRAAQDPVELVIQDRTLFRARAGVAGQWVAIELIGAPGEDRAHE